jgi:hypothetical protein
MSMPKGKTMRPASYGCGGWRPLVKPDPTRQSWWLDLPQDGFTAASETHSIKVHTGPVRERGLYAEEHIERRLKKPFTTLDAAATLGNYD